MNQEERTILKAVIGLVLVSLGLLGLFSSSYGMDRMMGWMMKRWIWGSWYGGFTYYLNIFSTVVSLIVITLGIYIILNVARGKIRLDGE